MVRGKRASTAQSSSPGPAVAGSGGGDPNDDGEPSDASSIRAAAGDSTFEDSDDERDGEDPRGRGGAPREAMPHAAVEHDRRAAVERDRRTVVGTTPPTEVDTRNFQPRQRDPEAGNVRLLFGTWGERASATKHPEHPGLPELQLRHGPCQVVALAECIAECECVLQQPGTYAGVSAPAVAGAGADGDCRSLIGQPSFSLMAIRSNECSGLGLAAWKKTALTECRFLLAPIRRNVQDDRWRHAARAHPCYWSRSRI